MSTRSHIVFQEKRRWTDDDGAARQRTDRILTYKHHDGYPRGTVPMLRRFHEYARERSNDLEYYAASWMFWAKARRVKNSDRRDYGTEWGDADDEVPKQLTGFGICPGMRLHGDVEYLWLVDVNRGVVEQYEFEDHWPGDDEKEVSDVVDRKEPVETYGLEEDPLDGF